jgi:hypothetical protein
VDARQLLQGMRRQCFGRVLAVNEVRCVCVLVCLHASPAKRRHTRGCLQQVGRCNRAHAVCCTRPATQYVVVDLPGCQPLLLRVAAANTLSAEEQQEVVAYHCFRCEPCGPVGPCGLHTRVQLV